MKEIISSFVFVIALMIFAFICMLTWIWNLYQFKGYKKRCYKHRDAFLDSKFFSVIKSAIRWGLPDFV